MKFLILIAVVVILIFWVSATPAPFCKENQSPGIKLTIEEYSAIKESNISVVHVNGTSMLPTLKNGSNCVCARKKEYKVGDIIVFPLVFDNGRENKIIVHRINKTYNDSILTKGDNNRVVDSPIKKDDVFCYIPEIPKYLKLFY